jgi:hypothetical protein
VQAATVRADLATFRGRLTRLAEKSEEYAQSLHVNVAPATPGLPKQALVGAEIRCEYRLSTQLLPISARLRIDRRAGRIHSRTSTGITVLYV